MTFDDPLLQPFTLKHLTLSSRIVSISHEPAYAEEGLPKDRYLRYQLEKARGGVSLTMIGGSACVSPDSPAFIHNIALYRDEVVPHLQRLADAVHDHGTLVMCQVTHAGRRTSNYAGDWLPIISASRSREPLHKEFPKVAEDWDIERIINDYADSVARCQAAGLDGVELLGAGHLLDQFWSPATNFRNDEWGGDFERRLKFAISVLKAIRAKVGNEFVVGARISLDEQLSNGITVDTGIELVNRLTNEGLDFVNVNRGGYESDQRLEATIPNMGTPFNPHLDFVGEMKKRISIPVMHAGRIRDFDTARDAIRSNKTDLVGMVRPFFADPYLMTHLRNGTPERIRPAVGSGYGLDRVYMGGDLVDIGNAATGREQHLPHIVPAAPHCVRAVVVGAGIAGLEAARTLAERGHSVTLMEATSRAGGQILLAASLPRRQELLQLIDWRLRELKRLGVEVRYETVATAEQIERESADIVIIATGGTPALDGIAGDIDAVTNGWDVLTGSATITGDVLLYDDNGEHPGLTVAETLLEAGANLEFVTPERLVGVHLGTVNAPPYLRSLTNHSARITLTTELTEIRRLENGKISAVLVESYTGQRSERIVDHVLVEQGVYPEDSLYFDLKPKSLNGGAVDQHALVNVQPQSLIRNTDGQFKLFRIGDAISSRNIPAAVLDAYRLCLAL